MKSLCQLKSISTYNANTPIEKIFKKRTLPYFIMNLFNLIIKNCIADDKNIIPNDCMNGYS